MGELRQAALCASDALVPQLAASAGIDEAEMKSKNENRI